MSKPFVLSLVLLIAPSAATAETQLPTSPNIVFVLCDDLGYGDVQCLAPKTSRIPTPHADRLAAEGLTLTNAHSGSSVCTPTRYGILTGRYCWRTHLQKGVVTGFAPSLIAPDRKTVAGFLQDQGYHTAIIGKWHLNFDYQNPTTKEPYQRKDHKRPPIGSKIPDGPLARGFDSFHGFHHARDMSAVINDDEVIEYDEPVNMLPRLRRKAVDYIAERAKSDAPFFLYMPLGSPHTPIVPSDAWKGKSGLGDYADFVMQTDDALGGVLEALEEHNLASNTLVIFTSDNGCSKAANILALAKQGHLVSAHLRGSKADIWDGGHQIPFLARWPEMITAGSTSNQLVCLGDFFATVAELVDKPVPGNSCEDSISFLPVLSGNATEAGRQSLVHHSFSGHFAYRDGPWKLVLAYGSGGWSSPNEKAAKRANARPAQLYNLSDDPSETRNLYDTHPEIVQQLLVKLESDVLAGRTTEGPPASNDVDTILLWKSGAPE